MFTSFALLSEAAEAGGTGEEGCGGALPPYCHLDMSAEEDLAEALKSALTSILNGVGSCAVELPTELDDDVNVDELNLLLLPGDGSVEVLGRQESPECEEGWFQDEERAAPTLCTESCARLRGAPMAHVEVLFGCEAVEPPPPT